MLFGLILSLLCRISTIDLVKELLLLVRTKYPPIAVDLAESPGPVN